MSFSESSNDSDWNLNGYLKKKKKDSDEDRKKSSTKTLKRRNFCEKWLIIFSPWLIRSKVDPNVPYCRACQCHLGNNGYHLHRHEKTTKHARNQEILLNEGEEAVRTHLNRNVRQTKTSALEIEHTTEFESEIPFKQEHTIPKRFKTLLENDESESPFIYTKRKYQAPTPLHSQHSYQTTEQPMFQLHSKRDSFDMFFEAISATVKGLPPKLAAEVKSRVSQVVTEFELRAICEKEAQEKAQQQSIITIPTNVVTVDSVMSTGTNVVHLKE